ncbi:ketosteroid isomerase-like protein [Pseudonocardia hierapolitana]|uniref:Ketosteroid isomerase-like protein n=1 Tax=Pseudonocardia hierapolitana TaxID=1128676 RepID=A0A561T3S2_9PSEU|nr:nuclear transport factor 2 family protein [Pseudonocardia hierapolitana]TWF81764.1 ketosteroid isomerase-like protein [Pseudonocardia hierapolitana]
MTTLDVVDRAMDLLLAHDMAGFAGLWAVDGAMEFPFAPDGYPQRLDGRAAVAEYLRDYTDHVDLRAITSRTVHRTADPEVVVVEFEVDGIAVRTGRPYRMRYISVITVRNGEIAGYRDYWSPLAAAEALGGADELTAFGVSGGDR